jgi:hypothetical protein
VMTAKIGTCVQRSAQVSTGEPADAHLQGDAVLDPALVLVSVWTFMCLMPLGVLGVM